MPCALALKGKPIADKQRKNKNTKTNRIGPIQHVPVSQLKNNHILGDFLPHLQSLTSGSSPRNHRWELVWRTQDLRENEQAIINKRFAGITSPPHKAT